MLGKLVPCGGGAPIPLLKPRLVLGRHNACDIPLPVLTVSARHCELELRDQYWFVRDLKSSNGTRVNGVDCTEQWVLPGDVLGLAGCRFNVVYAPPPCRPPPQRLDPVPGSKPTPEPPCRVDKLIPLTQPASSGRLLGELLPCGGGDPIPLRKPKLVLGRRSECDIPIPIGVVSGRHCELEFKDGYWYVHDLNSRHGTRVDGAQVLSNVLLPGSVLWLANVRFKLAYRAAGGPPAAAHGPSFAQNLLEAAGLARWQPPEPHGKQKDDDPHRERYTIEE
jgi:adenylate cyclase